MPARTIAIGDVHGCADALRGLVDLIEPGTEDVVVTLGDYIDRGPDSRGVLEALIELGGRCRLVPLLGNHEEALLEALSGRTRGHGWLGMGGLATLQSYGAAWGQLDAIPPEHVAFLEGCRDFHETETHFFVHAQYLPYDPLESQSTLWLRWESLRDVVPEAHVSGKRAIVGHTPQKSGEPLDLGYLVCIDTYCYGGGWLTAFEVETNRVWQVDRRGEPRRRDAASA